MAGPPSTSSPALLALLPSSVAAPVEDVAPSLGLAVRRVSSISALLTALREGPFVATLVSLGEHDLHQPLARRVAEEGNAGALLLLSSPGASLERAPMAERSGAAALLREPFSGAGELGTLASRPSRRPRGARAATPLNPLRQELIRRIGRTESHAKPPV